MEKSCPFMSDRNGKPQKCMKEKCKFWIIFQDPKGSDNFGDCIFNITARAILKTIDTLILKQNQTIIKA